MTIESTMTAPRAERPGAPTSPFAFLRRVLATLAERRRRRRAEAELQAMSDRELRDLGLDRASIRAAVEGRF